MRLLKKLFSATPELPVDDTFGSAWWLYQTELKYGGLQSRVERRKVSELDPRSERELRKGGMRGGDRMSPDQHNYAPFYEEHLGRFLGRPVVFGEVGILRGNGLAIWSDLFSQGQILGFDIDLSHTRENMPKLRALGAFTAENVELHEFDQFRDGPGNVAMALAGRKFDVVVDDGFHSEEAIIKTFEAFRPHLADGFVYIVEDNDKTASFMRARLAGLEIVQSGDISAIFEKR